MLTVCFLFVLKNGGAAGAGEGHHDVRLQAGMVRVLEEQGARDARPEAQAEARRVAQKVNKAVHIDLSELVE